MEVRTLKRAAFLVLAGYSELFQRISEAIETGTPIDVTGDVLDMLGKFEPYAAEHVRNIEGITADGQPLTPEIVFQEGTFYPLAMTIIGQLLSVSSLTRAQEKNSDARSGLQNYLADRAEKKSTG